MIISKLFVYSRKVRDTAGRLLLSRHASSDAQDFTLYDSLSDSYKSVSTTTDKGIAWYTCGPTTYAPAHLGHARTYVCLDIVRRVLEEHHHSSRRQHAPPPLFVLNITDVDDKILTAAQGSDEPPLELARRFEEDFWKDLDALHCLRPHVVTRVSEHVDSDVVPYIERLCETGMAYESDDGVYFDVRGYEEKLGTVTKYGKLAPPSAASDFFNLDESQIDTKKKDPRDFVLWKKRKEGEELYWDSPWGVGRPGWHIECSAMIEAVSKAFSETHDFMFHAGGVDLKFPHHANEIAQSEAYHASHMLENGSKEWIPHWVHTGHLHIDGLKMSKSLKNFITIEELLDDNGASSALTSPADDFRLWCLGLAGSYRGSATYSRARIDEARAMREKIVKFLLDASEWLENSSNSNPKKWMKSDHELYADFNSSLKRTNEALMNDLNGKLFLREVVASTEMGSAYLRSNPLAATEPMVHCIASLRDLLALVGFSPKTFLAGVNQNSGQASEGIAGGERALIEEMVKFRTRVRNAALADIQSEGSKESLVEILQLCDEARETALPAIGLELVDGDSMKSWSFCLPRDAESDKGDGNTSGNTSAPKLSRADIPLADFFKLGQYEGLFSEHDENGLPKTNADGTEISKRQMKKLMKKRSKHEHLLRSREGD